MAEFTKGFEKKILNCLLNSNEFANSIAQTDRLSDYIEDGITSILVESSIGYVRRFKKIPDTDELFREATKLQNSHKGDKEFADDEILDAIKDCKKMKVNKPYAIEEVYKFMNLKKIEEGLITAAEFTNIGDLESALGSMTKSTKLLQANFDPGINYFASLERNYEKEEDSVPTGIGPLDNWLQGGLSIGELGVIMGVTGIGKSMALTHMGRNAVLNKKKVVHYTFELSERKTMRRYDASFTSIVYDNLSNEEDFIEAKRKLTKLRKKLGQNLFIKEYPAHSCTVNMLRSHLEKLGSLGYIPDMMVLDYADLMRSSRKYEQRYIELGLVYEELRGLATELRIPIWTGTQTHRSAMDKDIVGLQNVADSFEKMMIADVVVTLNQTLNEKRDNIIRLFLAKNRSGRGGGEIEVACDFSRAQFCLSAVEV